MKNMKFTPEKIGILKSIFNHVRLVGRLLKDARVPSYLKVLPFAPLLYALFPLDVIPDLIPIVGQLDDLGVILLGLQTFISMSPQEVVQEHRDELAGSKPFGSAASNASANKNETVDGQWTVVDKDL
jgi:uncharacterized membrane protein YkvA (DUF1232 family)